MKKPEKIRIDKNTILERTGKIVYCESKNGGAAHYCHIYRKLTRNPETGETTFELVEGRPIFPDKEPDKTMVTILSEVTKWLSSQ